MSLPNPIVLLDARARYVHPAFQMTRASTKTVFDSGGRLVTVPANALGWDHDPATGQSRGYLSEPSATNLILRSNDLPQVVWVTSGTSVTPNAIIGPDGNGMAKLVEDSSSGIHMVYQNLAISDSAPVVCSVIVKTGEREQFRCQIIDQSSNNRVEIDVANGTITNALSGGAATINDYGVEAIGGGFYYCWLTGLLGAGTTNVRARVFLLDDNGNSSYQGDGTSGLYLGYCQAEEGSYPTSYIETGAATATRAGDRLRVSRADSIPLWRSRAGCFLLDLYIPVARLTGGYFRIDDNVDIRHSGVLGAVSVSGNAIDTSGGSTLLQPEDQPGRHRIAFAWDDGDGWVAAVDGQIAQQGDMSGAISDSSSVNLLNSTVGTNQPGGYGGRTIYLPQRPSNANLQSLTAIQE